jgi:hypothetical protein
VSAPGSAAASDKARIPARKTDESGNIIFLCVYRDAWRKANEPDFFLAASHGAAGFRRTVTLNGISREPT